MKKYIGLIFTFILTSFFPSAFSLADDSYHLSFSENPVKWDEILAVADFRDYDKEHAKMLVDVDTAGRRNFEMSGAEKGGRKTKFKAVYGRDGIYFRIECEEPEMGKILNGQVKDGGSLEIFLVPGNKDEYYYMFMADLANRKLEEYNMFNRTEGYRPASGFFKADISAGQQGWIIDMYLPYILFYSKLPLDGESWRFNIVRWMPSFTKQGGVTWQGKVHDPGSYRCISFDKPTQEQLLAIRRGIVRQAYARFAGQIAEMKIMYSRLDPCFYQEILEPLITKYEACSNTVANIDTISEDILLELFQSVPAWTDFRYRASDLRKEYLKNKLLR